MFNFYAKVSIGINRKTLFVAFAGIFFLGACKAPATYIQNPGNFSNLRSMVYLADGTVLHGYSSVNMQGGAKNLSFQVPGKRTLQLIPLSEVTMVTAEEHSFLVKTIENPSLAVRDGQARVVTAMVRRVGSEKDPVQVYEYKYLVRNSKSPLKKHMTAYYAEFPGKSNLPVTQVGSKQYNGLWHTFIRQEQKHATKNLHPSLNDAPANHKALVSTMENFLNMHSKNE